MIARPSPSSVPRAMLATVRKIVSISPRRMDSCVKYWATTPHLKFGLVEDGGEDPDADQDAQDPSRVLGAGPKPKPWLEGCIHAAHRRFYFLC